MDVLIAYIKRFSEYWAVLAGVLAVAAGWCRYGRKHGSRLLRSMDLSDSLHERFGYEKAAELVSEIHNNHIDSAVREVRVALLERRASAAVYVCNSETGECTYANSELAELFGLDAADFAGNGWLNAILSDDRAEVWQRWQHAVKQKIPYECDYNIINQRTGEAFMCHTKAYPAKLKTGKIVWYVGTVEVIEK